MFKKENLKANNLFGSGAGNTTFIGTGSELKGSLHCNALRVDGVIYGDVHSQGDIEVASTGRIEGDLIRGHDISVHGIVKSNIHATGFLRIHKNANVQGDVTAQALDIEAGAHFVGYSHTGDNTEPQPPKALADKTTTITQPMA